MSSKTKLSIRQRSNIRFFTYYLVNGSLDFDLLHNQLSVEYHDYLKEHPELFYKACCAFIDQECQHNPNWPPVKRLAVMIAYWIEPEKFNNLIDMDAETDCDIDKIGLKEAFLEFSYRFSIAQSKFPFIDSVTYTDFISDGANNVETCFAIWANVIEFENGSVINQDYAISRVKEYLKMYYRNGYQAQLEDWEWELHLFEG